MSTRKAIQNSMTGAATNWDCNNSFTRMRSNTSWGTVLWRLVGSVWYTKSQPHSWIFTSVSVGSSPRTLLISATVRIPVHPAPKLAQNLFRVQPGTASRCNINPAITFLMCWQRPFRPSGIVSVRLMVYAVPLLPVPISLIICLRKSSTSSLVWCNTPLSAPQENAAQ